MLADALREPWRSFLEQVDQALPGPTELHCLGGFVLAACFGLERPTADVDIIEARGTVGPGRLRELAGKESALARDHKVYLDIVTVAAVPENYEERLVELGHRGFSNLRLLALERHDLALAKLGRNADYDREDVKRLAVGPGLDVAILRSRYEQELRYQFGNPAREDLTLQLWIEMIEEIQESAG